ncbi:MAG: TonB-dependent receptor [Steroidobacteraceae bacterium]|jgi:outer membrane receptor protein involved in Fe transport|nr:TonB-dependent receptor [Steroidobacteraceae bacterium]
MSTSKSVRRAVRYALLSGAVATGVISTPTQAQDSESIQEVVVTGSRIRVPNLESISPVTAISEEDIQMTGKVRVEDIVNQLPQAFAAQGSSVSNGATGTATVDLRGLGAKRTLVLVNGRRLMSGTPSSFPDNSAGAADLNMIPASLIDRVEVLTGGASSVYGADAVAGVVNFIMNTRFEGVRVDANYSFYNHENDNSVADIVRDAGYQLPKGTVNGGYTKEISFLLGSNFADDRGNATFYASYRNVDELLQADYDYSACSFNSGDAFSCGGSSTSFPGRFLTVDPNTGDIAGSLTFDGAGGMRPYTGADAYNYGPLNHYQRPEERYSAGAFLNLDVTDNMTSYAEFMFMRDESVAQIAPSGSFLQQFTFSCDNPLWSDAQRQAFCGDLGLGGGDSVDILVGRRNVEGGGRQQDFTHESYRAVIGLRGDINENWSFDVYGQYGQASLSSIYYNDFSITRLGRALDVVDDGAGNVVCRSVVDGSDPTCVPWNIWTPGGVTADQLNYLQIPLIQTGKTTEKILNASVTGDLGAYGVQLPTAKSGLMVNVGAEYREESSDLIPDASYQTGDGAGQGGATLPIGGGYRVKDLFFEARLPILEDMRLADSLSAEAGYRYSDYSTDWETDTYKLGLEWAPIQGLRARASFQRAVRVPNVAELYSTQQVTLDGTIDPCAGDNPTLTLEQCIRTGVTAAQYGNITENSAAQYNGFFGGNPDLEPETADTFSVGLAFQPSFAPGLRFQVDYFDIKIEDAIQNPNADFTLLLCALNGDPDLCNRVNRDSLGSLWLTSDGYVYDVLENIGEIRTKGFDFDVGYDLDIGSAGRLGLSLKGTLLESIDTTPQAGVTYDCTGLYGAICGVPAPEWRHKMDARWRTPWAGIDLTLSWRYFDAVKRDAEDSNQYLAFLGTATGALPTDSKLGSRSYIDLTGSMSFADRYTVRVGVNNLFDKDPPLNGSDSCPTGSCNGNTWPQVYDSLGRQIFGVLTVNF